MNNLPTTKNLSIKEAAQVLSVSTKTLRRWEERGLISSQRTPGGHRRYSLGELKAFRKSRRAIINSRKVLLKLERAEANQVAVPKRIHGQREWQDLMHELPMQKMKQVTRGMVALGLVILGTSQLSPRAASSFLQSRIDRNANHVYQNTSNGVVLAESISLDEMAFNLNVPTNIAQELTVDGVVTIGDALNVSGDTDMDGSLTVGESLTIDGLGTGLVTSTGGLLTLSTGIDGGLLDEGSVLEVGLSSTNDATDDYVLSYDLGTGGFTWVAQTTDTDTDTNYWSDAGTYVYLTTTTDKLRLGASAAASALLHVGSAGTPGSIDGTDDLYVYDDLEVDGVIYGSISGTVSPGFTEGSVVFADSSGNLAQDNGNFFWDDTSNRLGIGTTAPSASFDLQGNGRLGSTFNFSPDVDQGADLGTSSLYWNNLYVANINSSATLSSLGQLVVTYDPADTTYAESSILINPTAPEANEWLLGVGMGGYQRAGIDVEGNLVVGYNDAVTAPLSDNPFRVYNNGSSEIFTVASSGNVGIGATSPGAKLHVSGGTLRLDNNQNVNFVNAADSGTIRSLGLSAADALLIGSVGGPGGSAAMTIDIDGYIGMVGGLGIGTTAAGGFATAAVAESNLAVEGSVGIGITNPFFALDVWDNVGTVSGPGAVQLRLNDTSTAAQDVGGAIGLGGYYSAAGARTVFGAVKSGKENATDGNYSTYLNFFTRTNGSLLTEKLRITSDGNVGIGITNPDTFANAKAVVRTGTSFGITSSEAYGLVVGADSANTHNALWVSSYGDGAATSVTGAVAVPYSTGGPSNLISYQSIPTLSGSGNVTNIIDFQSNPSITGTGTVTNTYGFQVNDISTNNGTMTNAYGVHVGDITLGTQTNTPYSFYASDANAYNYFAGNVGIGTTDPGAKLHVSGGTLRLDNNQNVNFVNAADSGTIRSLGLSAADALLIGSVGGPGGSAAMTIDIDGYIGMVGGLGIGTTAAGGFATAAVAESNLAVEGSVGIGTTGPGYKLDVAGTGRFTGTTYHYNHLELRNGYNFIGYSNDGVTQIFNFDAGATTHTINQGIITFNEDGVNTSDFRVEGDTDPALFFVDASTDNVGIGTTSPQTLLNVSGTDTPEIRITETTGNVGDYGALSLISSAAGSPFAQIRGIYSAVSDGDISFLTTTNGGTLVEQMRITDDGLVGIGTTAPSSTLDVRGNVRLNTATSGNFSADVNIKGDVSILSEALSQTTIIGRYTTESVSINVDDFGVVFESIQDEDSVGYGNMAFRVDDDGTADGYFAFQAKSGAEYLRIEDGGYVGIDKADPQALLHVGTGSEDSLDGINDAYVSDDLEVDGDIFGLNIFGTKLTTNGYVGSGIEIDVASGYAFNVDTGNVERLNIASGGTVVFNDTGADADFRVEGDVDTSLFFVDASTDRIGIGTTAPGTKLGVAGGVGIGTTDSFANAAVAANNLAVQGSVGIGVTNPSYSLDVLTSGTGIIARFNSDNTTGCTLATGGTISCSSDAALKKNVSELGDGLLNTLSQLRPVSFNWNYENEGEAGQAGFIAQEVELVLPELVNTDDSTGYKQLNTIGLVPYLVTAVQELNDQLSKLNDQTTSNELMNNVQNTDIGAVGTDITAESVTATNLTVIGESVLADTTISGMLNIGTIQIDPIENSIDAVGMLLIQPLGLGAVEIMGGLVNIDTEGNLKAVEVEAEKYKVAGASAGSSTLPLGETKIFVETDQVSEDSLVFVTLSTSARHPISVGERVLLGENDPAVVPGFWVEIAEVESGDVEFSWWIVDKIPEETAVIY